MKADKFTSGTIVKLKSGGPSMTVSEQLANGKGYMCHWFGGKKLEQGYFSEDELERVEEGKE